MLSSTRRYVFEPLHVGVSARVGRRGDPSRGGSHRAMSTSNLMASTRGNTPTRNVGRSLIPQGLSAGLAPVVLFALVDSKDTGGVYEEWPDERAQGPRDAS
jgi:hypothetical protein